MPVGNSFPFSLDKRDVEGSHQAEGGPEQPLAAVLLGELLQEAEPAAGRAAAAGQAAPDPAGCEWACPCLVGGRARRIACLLRWEGRWAWPESQPKGACTSGSNSLAPSLVRAKEGTVRFPLICHELGGCISEDEEPAGQWSRLVLPSTGFSPLLHFSATAIPSLTVASTFLARGQDL